MSFEAVRDGLQTVLANNLTLPVAYEDEQALNTGIAHAVVLRFARVSQQFASFGPSFWADWQFTAELYTALSPDVPTARAMQDVDRAAILLALARYPNLDRTEGVFMALATGSAPGSDDVQFGGLHFIREDITITVREDVPSVARE